MGMGRAGGRLMAYCTMSERNLKHRLKVDHASAAAAAAERTDRKRKRRSDERENPIMPTAAAAALPQFLPHRQTGLVGSLHLDGVIYIYLHGSGMVEE